MTYEKPGAFEMRDVVDRAGGQVVEDRHLVAVAQQSFGEVGSDEPGAAGNQGFHAGRCPFANAATASATRTTSSSASRGCSGSDNSSRRRGAATGHSRGTNAANAGWLGQRDRVMNQRLDAGRARCACSASRSVARTGNRWYTWPGSRSRMVRTDDRSCVR